MSDSKTQIDRRSTGRSVIVTPELPPPPKEFLSDPILAGAWKRWMFQLNEWRKNIQIGSNFTSSGIRASLIMTGSSFTTSQVTTPSPTPTPVVQPPPVVAPPPSGPGSGSSVTEQDLRSLLKLDWIGL